MHQDKAGALLPHFKKLVDPPPALPHTMQRSPTTDPHLLKGASMRSLLFGVAALAILGLMSGSAHAQAKKDQGNTAVRPDPRRSLQPDPGWLKRHETFVGIAKKGDVDVLFLGDSITDAWGGEGHGGGNGAAIFKERFVPMKAANFGIGGDQTQHVLWRLQNGELDGIKPKVAMLMIGTNNMGGNTAEQIAEGVTAIVKEIQKRSPTTKVLLLGIFPRAEKADNPVREKIKQCNSIFAKLDDGGKTVKYLDIGGKFLEPDGSLSKDIMPDFLHLSAEGYKRWADAVEGPIKELMK
jgi:lysophospholipase L1-like esterase